MQLIQKPLYLPYHQADNTNINCSEEHEPMCCVTGLVEQSCHRPYHSEQPPPIKFDKMRLLGLARQAPQLMDTDQAKFSCVSDHEKSHQVP